MPTTTKLLDLNEVADVVVKLAMEKFEKAMNTVDNPPLTWNELKDMEGKPVWVEDNNGWYKGWVIIEKFVEDDMFTTGFTYEKNNFGTLWQAYRKEKE